MKYTVKNLAVAAGVTIRTLHYYDQIGLLSPGREELNGYRYYTKNDLLRLQQILIYREMEVPLDTVRRILDESGFDYIQALQEHYARLEKEKDRMETLINTVRKTINSLQKGESMTAQDMYGGLTKKQHEEYSREADERWGNTAAWQESQSRVKAMGKRGLKKVFEESQKIVAEFVSLMNQDVKSEAVQAVVARHRANIGHFYTVTDEIYEGLAHMYVDDPRFTATYEKSAPGLASFISRAMLTSLGK